MLGYVRADARGEADRLLAAAAEALRAGGVALAGVVQVNDEFDPARPCHMDLHILNGRQVIRISQNLGALSKGCRLDPAGLEQAVGLTAQALEALTATAGPRLLIINKFGKQEAEGRGFRPLIGQALAQGLPVLTAVNGANLAAFSAFADGMGAALPPDLPTILRWCQHQTVHTPFKEPT